MRRLVSLLGTSLLALLLLAPSALAESDHGEGLLGETDDRIITTAGFIVIAFFPLFISLMSFIQWKLDKRKDARKAAAKARQGRAEPRGGW